MTTKEQEREALKKIKKIVEGLGVESYIGIALRGCLEDAAINIENDWALSMAQRVDALNGQVSALQVENYDLNIAVKKEQERADAAEARYNELRKKQLGKDDLDDFSQMLKDAIHECNETIIKDSEDIVALADNPTGVAFIDAVNSHRRAQKKLQYLMDVLARVKLAKSND